jgi:hypothetical protein
MKKIFLMVLACSFLISCSPAFNPYMMMAEYKRLKVRYPGEVQQCEDQLGTDAGVAEIVNCSQEKIYGPERTKRPDLDAYRK